MSFELDLARPVAEQLPSLLRRELLGAARALHDVENEPRPAFRAARDRLERARAVLELAGSAVDVAELRQRLAHLARQLYRLRPSGTMVETFDALADRYGTRYPDLPWDAVVGRLSRMLLGSSDELDLASLSRVEVALEESAHAISLWNVESDGFALLRPGLSDTYAAVRRQHAAARREGSEETLDAWLELLDHHILQLRLLAPVWPAILAPQIDHLEALAGRLREARRLAPLLVALAAKPDLFGGVSAVRPLRRVLQQRRQELEEEAFALAPRTLTEAPEALTARIRGYWTYACQP